MTPEERSTQRVRDWLLDSAPTLHEATDGLDHLLALLPVTPQRRRWPWIGWSAPDARRSLAVASLLVATAVGAAALASITQLDGPRPIVVAADGSGDVRTIGAGVAMAHDGDTVLVRPGTYEEQVSITNDITVAGDGPREAIVWMAAGGDTRVDGPEGGRVSTIATSHAVAFDAGSAATVRGLTIVGRGDGMAVIVGEGADPIIEEVTITVPGPWTGMGMPITWSDRSAGTLRDSTVSGYIRISNRGAAPLIEDNVMPGTCIVVLEGGGTTDEPALPVIRHNQITGCSRGILLQAQAGTLVVERNDLTMEAGTAISLAGVSGATVRDNVIHDSGQAIAIVNPRGTVALEANTITGNEVGIGVFGQIDGVRLGSNRLRDNAIGLNLASAQDPLLEGNTVCRNGVDVRVVPADRPPPSPVGIVDCAALASPAPD